MPQAPRPKIIAPNSMTSAFMTGSHSTAATQARVRLREEAMAKYEISMDDPRELWEELFARIAADAEDPEADREKGSALEAAGVFFPAWHVL